MIQLSIQKDIFINKYQTIKKQQPEIRIIIAIALYSLRPISL